MRHFEICREGRLFAIGHTMAAARHFAELDCWQLAEQLRCAMYELVSSSDTDRDLRFRDQVRAAADSIPRNIEEGFGRKSDGEFVRFLSYARGSVNEVQGHLRSALDRGCLTEERYQELLVLSKRTAGAIAGLQRYLRAELANRRR